MQPFVLQLQVEAEEMDMLGHVNNVVYQRYLERAAIAHSAHIGFTLARYRDLGGVFVLRRIEIDYLRSAVAGDVLEISTWIGHTKGTRAMRHYEIRKQDDPELLLTAKALWVWVDLEAMRPKPIPKPLLHRFEELSAPFI